MGEMHTINSDTTLQAAQKWLAENFAKHKYSTYEVRHGAPRTLAQNNLTFALFKPISDKLFDQNLDYARAVCKLTKGVPIMRRDSPSFREKYDQILKPLSYEEKVDAIMVFDLPVTRLMTKKQLTEFIEAVCAEYASKGVVFSELKRDQRA